MFAPLLNAQLKRVQPVARSALSVDINHVLAAGPRDQAGNVHGFSGGHFSVGTRRSPWPSET